jgi:hypothetical protein
MPIIPQEQILGCGDTSCEYLVSPIPRPKRKRLSVVLRPHSRRIIMLDHGKPNSTTIFQRAQQLLRQMGVDVADAIMRKPHASVPMADAMLADLAHEEGLVLCGVSDCGSCSAGSSIDAVLLQERGVAGVPVLTRPFAEQLERVTAYYQTDHPMPLIVIDHPTQNIEPAELDLRARAIADAALALLDGATRFL